MRFTRRAFVHRGVAAFAFGFTAPSFLSDLARAQNARGRNLVVLFLNGGNDALSTLVPYNDAAYYRRRPTQAVPAGRVLHIGRDSSGIAHGLHPNLTGLRSIFNSGRLAIIQRTGYPNASRSHFLGTDLVSTANPPNAAGPGWLGRYLDTLPSPVDPLIAWNTAWRLPTALRSRGVGVPSIEDAAEYAFANPLGEGGVERAKAAMVSITSRPRPESHLAFVNGTTEAALATLDRVATVAAYTPTVRYPSTNFGKALEAVAGALANEIGTQIFWVELHGFDTHASQGTEDRCAQRPPDHPGRWVVRVLHGPVQPEAERPDAGAPVLRVWPEGLRERQRRHRPWRRRADDGARRAGARRTLRHGREPGGLPVEPDT